MYRKRMTRRRSRKNFSRNARVHPKNVRLNPMRGGYRI